MCKWANAVAWTSDATLCTHGTLAAGFSNTLYWSSSEYDGSNSSVQDFYAGVQLNFGKGTTNYPRPVRAF
jgi:hypothetical protein